MILNSCKRDFITHLRRKYQMSEGDAITVKDAVSKRLKIEFLEVFEVNISDVKMPGSTKFARSKVFQ